MKNQISFLIFALSLVLFGGCNKENSLVTVSQNNLSKVENDLILKSASLKSKYIVILNNDADITRSALDDKMEKMKSRISGLLKKNSITENPEETYQSALQGFTLKMTAGEAKKLALDGNVKRIEVDKVVSINDKSGVISESAGKGKGKKFSTVIPSDAPASTDIIPWGVTRVGGGINAIGKTVWVIDSGIDLTHPDLNIDVARSKSFLGETTTPNDENGHGTHVAGIIAAINGNNIGVAGVAAGATLVAVRVFDLNACGTVSTMIAGIDYVASYGKAGDVANISGTSEISEALDIAVLNASNTIEGVKFVLCAGNQANDVNQRSPARVNGPNVYTISAMDNYDTYTSVSNFGNPTIDFCAPGLNIISTYKDGGYAVLSGTSMSAPHVAGLLLIGTVNIGGYVLGDPDGMPDPIAHHFPITVKK